MRNRFDIQIEIRIAFLAQVAKHFCVRPFFLGLVQGNLAFDDHFGIGRHQYVARLALDEFERFAHEGAGHIVFVFADMRDFRATHGPGDRIGTEHDGGFDGFFAAFFGGGQKYPPVLTDLGIHADAGRTLDLATVRADIAAEFGIFEYDATAVDITSTVCRIALFPRILEHIDVVARDPNLLARRFSAFEHDGLDAFPVAVPIGETHEVLNGGPIHFALILGDRRDAVAHGLGVPGSEDVRENRTLDPLAVDLHLLDEKSRGAVEAVLVDEPVGKSGRLVLILVHLLDPEHAPGRLEGFDVVAH